MRSKPQKVDEMKFFLYRGLFRCAECGFTITADRKIKASGKQYVYYYCTKKIRSMNVIRMSSPRKKISRPDTGGDQKVSLPDHCADWMLNELTKEQKEETESSALCQGTENEITRSTRSWKN